MKTKGLAETEAELKALKLFHASIEKIDGRYQVQWPWVEIPPPLPYNYNLAFARLKGQLKKLKDSKDFFMRYNEYFQDLAKQGIIESVTPTIPKDTVSHYLLHKGILDLTKSTPLRVIFDASAKTKAGNRSLNDGIHKSCTLMPEIPLILLQFRLQKVAIIADIRKAFHQILLHPKDRDVTRFLWVKDPGKPLDSDNLICYRFTRIPFGVIASPFILAATLQYHFLQNNPAFHEKFLQHIYVDNLVTSVPDTTAAKELYHIANQLFGAVSLQSVHLYLHKLDDNNPILHRDSRNQPNKRYLRQIASSTAHIPRFVHNTLTIMAENRTVVPKFAIIQTLKDSFQNIMFEPLKTPFGIRMENYSSLDKLIRALVAIRPVFQEYENILRRRIKKPKLFPLTQRWTRETALTLLIFADQQKHYSVILQQLTATPTKTDYVFLGKIHIVKASNGVLCKRNFLPNDTLSGTEKFPILLHPKSYQTQLIVLDVHNEIAHQQVAMTLAAIRRKYYIPRSYSTVQHILHKHYYNLLWVHWRKYYLLQLRDIPRYDLRNPKSTRPLNISPGDIVHLLDRKTKTGTYSLAGVTQLHKSHDGQVRSVSLILPNKTLTTRPLSQIAPLELHSNAVLLLGPKKTVAKLKN